MEMNPIQAWVESMNEAAKIASGREYNLGMLIKDLEPYKEEFLDVEFEDGSKPVEFDSWRGSYCELMLTYSNKSKMDSYDFYRLAFNTNGSMFTGYKGGDFIMDLNCPIHQDKYGGASGDKVIGIEKRGNKLVILTRNDRED